MERPDPDQLLDAIERDESRARRGRLKIFFGASAGVGKTYAMLVAAARQLRDGVDVLAGVIHTHGRAETAALLDGLPILPLRGIEYNGRTLEEFDLDAALERHPTLILIDELAHSNVPGARHVKRWQDVHELLDAGINVYTTLNVQHLESLNDIVGRIAGIRVRETVPDQVFDAADDVLVVDLPPEELLERLREGKVYVPHQAERAVKNFFRQGNLIALRELALRRTADRVDAQMREYRASQSIERIWQARERLMVCIGTSPGALALVRAGARLAAALRADWLAVYVETPATASVADPPAQKSGQGGALSPGAVATRALQLAQEMGAQTVTLSARNAAGVASTLLDYARVRNVSKIVIGAAGARTATGWRALLHKSVGSQLLRQAKEIDVTLVSVLDSPGVAQAADAPRGLRAAFAGLGDHRSPPSAYGWTLLLCGIVTMLVAALAGHIAPVNMVMIYLLSVVFVAARLGRGPGIMASLVNVASFDFFFVPPALSFTVSDTQYLLTFAVMLATALVISNLTSSLTREAQAATYRERRVGATYEMARELAAALDVTSIIEIATRHLHEVFRARSAILLPGADERVYRPAGGASEGEAEAASALAPAQLDTDIAQWVYDRQAPAGRGTDTLPAAQSLYLPLRAPMRTRGTLALSVDGEAEWDRLEAPDQRRLIDVFCAQVALALERVHYVEVAQDALLSMESERLRNSLLSAISHDLRTPLTAIVGLSSMLAGIETGGGVNASGESARRPLTDATRAELTAGLHEEAQRMSRMVTNLLEMARIEAGGVTIDGQWTMLEEVVGTALRACRGILAQRPVQVTLAPDLPLLRLDPVLIERVFANLLENAAKYSPPGTAIEIGAQRVQRNGDPFVRVTIDDGGPGLPPGEATRLFDKFTRGEKESAKPGIGLGLAICRAIVIAHGGEIGAYNRFADETSDNAMAAAAAAVISVTGGAVAAATDDAAAPPSHVVATALGSADSSRRVLGARFWFTLPLQPAPELP